MTTMTTYKMTYFNFQYLFIFLVLFSLYQIVKTSARKDSDDVAEMSVKNISGEIMRSEVNTTTTVTTVIYENFNGYEKEKQFIRKTKFNESELIARRKPRTVVNGSVAYGMVCLSCFANSSSGSWNCYSGYAMPSRACADAELCYTEINPLYIKRGCVLPGRVNRTFVCKCPLCNDKPSFDISHYEYKQINDWEYDNARLQAPLIGMDLMCKVCETKGTNPTSDKNCRSGKNADYMVCAHNQLCFTNIDDETDFVSRGCIDKPLFNSMYIFCNDANCNTDEFPNPHQRRRLRAHSIRLKDDNMRRRKALMSHGSRSITHRTCSIIMIALTLMQCA